MTVDDLFHALTAAVADGQRRRGVLRNRDPHVITLACEQPRLLGHEGELTGDHDDHGRPLVAFRLSQAQAMLDHIIDAALHDAGRHTP